MNTQVIYVAGSSYSGSTFFGAVLGNHDNMVCAGELHNWLKWFVHKDTTRQVCSCGAMLAQCPFWVQVKQEWLAETDLDLKAYQDSVVKYDRIRSIPLLLRRKNKPPHDFEIYQYGTKHLFDVIARVSGKSVVVGISKQPGRALALSLVDGIDLKYLHLVRNGLAYISSSLKHATFDELDMQNLQRMGDGKELIAARSEYTSDMPRISGWKMFSQVVRASLDWVLINQLCDSLPTFTKRPYFRMKYEDFVSRPGEALNGVGRFIGLDLADLSNKLQNGESISFGHTTGNIARVSGFAKLSVDRSWERRLPPYTKVVFYTIAWMQVLKYQYQ